mmetsp:Transcript_2680/g.5664  ORF Transcript_2680/g.5664 Transcript_2680/m.5664 type:complete len:318 (+) Transcript_2680:42-995(+)
MTGRGWQKQSNAFDDARALLDSLMGPKRDDKQRDDGIADGFLEKNVCKRYLVGLCPNAWFKSTKREMSQCGCVHSDLLVEELKAHPESARYTAEYEQDLLKYLEDIVQDSERWIAREKGNLKPPGKELQLSVGHQKQLAEKKEAYAAIVAECTRVEAEEDIEQSRLLMRKAQEVKEDIEELEAKFTVETGGESVCEMCGVRYPLGDTPNEKGNRESHFSGKMHEAYTIIREKVQELRKKQKDGDWERALKDKPSKEGKKERKGEKGGRDEDDKARKSDRDRDRDRDRGRRGGSRDRDRDRSRSRDRRKGRSRSRRRR